MPDSSVVLTSDAPSQDNRIAVAEVVVDVDAPNLQPVYSYRVPPQFACEIQPGSCVHIKFHGRERLGYVTGLSLLDAADPLAPKLHDILAVIEKSAAINEEQLLTARWMSERYVCDLLTAVRCMAPAPLGSNVVTKAILSNPTVTGASVSRSVRQAHIIETLRSLDGEAEIDALREAAAIGDFSSAYAALVARGVIRETRGIAGPRVTARTVRVFALSAQADHMLAGSMGRRSAQQQRIVNLLSERRLAGEPPITGPEISHIAQAGASALNALVDKGIVAVSTKAQRRYPYTGIKIGTEAPKLSQEQRDASIQIRSRIDSRSANTILLFGVTASGKTEVYLDAIAHTLALCRTAIVLVPEIALTTQLVEIFVGRFGDLVAVLHSRLSEGERHDEWRRIQQGAARIVVGARSAIFAPVSDVGLIVVDEEHESSYKQEKSPRYNAREVAAERARISSATLILGSATPSIETYYSTVQLGAGEPAILRIEMRRRIDSRPLPYVHIVDLREEFKYRIAMFSERLATAIGARLQSGQQTILFLNRRGYSQFVLCRSCGWTAKCRNCSISLAYHNMEHSLRCHYCGYTERVPTTCPDCHGSKVKAFGVGTEKVEEEVLKLFPSARVSRMDRDTTSTKGSHGKILRAFREREADVLIGTQMVAKGLDFPNVTLVGVVTADTSINMPDFRAAERTFQLLAQVAGRSGRGEHPGEVIIQTFSPEHYAVRAAMVHDYESFYNQEIEYRKELRYPPFSRLANIVCSHEKESDSRSQAALVSQAVYAVKTQAMQVIGPSPAPIARIKNQFRYHVALRAPVDSPLSDVVGAAIKRLKLAERQGLSIDIDPISMA